MRIRSIIFATATLVTAPAIAEEEPIDYAMINKITDEGFNRSHLMDNLTYLTDVIGPRLTNSPGMRQAAQWSKDQFTAYGLKNARFENFYFGPGWTYDEITVHMTAPRRTQLNAFPGSWHPGTDGVIEAETILAPMESEKDFENYKGKLSGKIVLVDKAKEKAEPSNNVFKRHDEESLAKRSEFPIPDDPDRSMGEFEKFMIFREKLVAFLSEEGALAFVDTSSRDAGLISAYGYQHKEDNLPAIPSIFVASEDYDRMARLIDRGETVSMSIDVKVQFHTDNLDAQNIIAEIPGRGSRPEIVIAGAHLDSWYVGDGAVDNAAGSAVMMEAARILSAIDAKPKRTIRFALWDGEEQGLYGSFHHVESHFASRPDTPPSEDRSSMKALWMYDVWPIKKGRDYERLSGYFNLDNGSGRIRGIYGEGNMALQPIFERWFEPFHEYGAETVVLRNTRGTDHEPFRAMGLPGFQFIQDPLDYGSRLHHTQIDTASHAYEKDLKQAAVIMASVLWHAANRNERLPRLPMPTEPKYPPEKEKEEKEE